MFVKVAASRSLVLFLRTSLYIIAIFVNCRASIILQLLADRTVFRELLHRGLQIARTEELT